MESVPVPTRDMIRSASAESMTLLVKGSVPAMAISAPERAEESTLFRETLTCGIAVDDPAGPEQGCHGLAMGIKDSLW